MAPPAAKCPTTVLDLDDGLLREVFLRLPALPSLVRAALSCRTFLRAVRSSPAFRRRFRELHPSPFVGLFIQRLLKCWEPEVASFDAHHCRPDRDFEAAVRGGDFSLAGLPLPDGDNQDRGDGDDMDEDDEEEEEDEDASPVWEIERCCDGYVVLFNRRTQQIAAYNPLTQALHLFPTPPGVFSDAVNYEFHIIYWTHVGKPYITVLDTTTLRFTKMDLPPLLVGQKGRECAFVLGNTKDGRPCIVSPDLWGSCSLDVFFWRRDDEDYDDGLNYWILDKTFPLKTIRRFIKFSEGDDEFIILRLLDVIDGIVYLRTEYDGCAEAPQLLLSFCLETAELKMICEDYHKPVHPYIMAWPPSLVVLDKGPCSKDEALSTPGSEGSDVKAGGGPTPTEPASVAKA